MGERSLMYSNLPNKKYNTIVLDPPWDISVTDRDWETFSIFS